MKTSFEEWSSLPGEVAVPWYRGSYEQGVEEGDKDARKILPVAGVHRTRPIHSKRILVEDMTGGQLPSNRNRARRNDIEEQDHKGMVFRGKDRHRGCQTNLAPLGRVSLALGQHPDEEKGTRSRDTSVAACSNLEEVAAQIRAREHIPS